MYTVGWIAQASDRTWQSGIEHVSAPSSSYAHDLVCEMLWGSGFVGDYTVRVVNKQA